MKILSVEKVSGFCLDISKKENVISMYNNFIVKASNQIFTLLKF